MPDVLIFGEDYAHEVVLRTLIQRLAVDYEVAVGLQVRSATGGHGRMLRELKAFIAELQRGRTRLPDLFIVARDANCLGYTARVKEITAALGGYEGLLVCAVPDPHVERWLLIDSQAFKEVLNHGCDPPDQKCDRDRYKMLLDAAVRAAGVDPLLGGVEFAEDLIQAMNLGRAERADKSFGHLLGDLRSAFQRWAAS
ncbi:MAG TPA: hypothetical protein VEL76_16680 [Gemmataceae bacterium]|nr:hypothetical protein [Gemmataceae bacterium]